MPAVATRPAKADKAAPQDIFQRLEDFRRGDLEAALVAYRGLVSALDADSNYEADPEHVAEVLDTLRIGPSELRADIEATRLIRDTQAAIMTDAQRAANEAERVEKTAEIKAIREKLPQLQARVRSLETMAAGDSITKADIARRRAANVRLFGSLDEVRERIANGKPTGPKVAGEYVPAPGGMVFSANRGL